jgi:hydrogenase maturation factor
MCLAQVCQVQSAPLDGTVRVRTDGRDMPVLLLTLDGPVEVGDWLLVHCGLALARLSDGDARAALAIRAPEVSP